MKLLRRGKDGGPESTVWGYWLVELKKLLSVVLLCFENGSRDAYHSHAFNAISWVLSGELVEEHRNGMVEYHRPSLIPILTRRATFHRVVSNGRSWVFQLRGPWAARWEEYIPNTQRNVTLTHGRLAVA